MEQKLKEIIKQLNDIEYDLCNLMLQQSEDPIIDLYDKAMDLIGEGKYYLEQLD